MLEQQEDIIEQWYFDKKARQEIALEKYLCQDHVLKNHDASCLAEVYTSSTDETTNANSKGDTGKKDL
jgi:hypothetical protein